jgi:hypothetical protein
MAYRIRAVVAASLALAATACGGSATPAERHLVYVRGNGVNTATVWIANVDGSRARRLGVGVAGLLSPDGRTVAIAHRHGGIFLISSGGGRERLLTARKLQPRAWSGDGETLLTTRSSGNAIIELEAVDRRSGRVRAIARGSLYGLDVSPKGDEVVYSRAPEVTARGICSDQFDLYVVKIDGGSRRRLTHDGLSAFPVWGHSRIAFSHFPAGLSIEDCSSPGIWTMDDDGSHRRPVIARAPESIVLLGFYGFQPLAWLDDARVLIGLRTDAGTEGAVLNIRTRTLRRLNVYADEASSDGRLAVGSGGEQELGLSIVRIDDGRRVFRRVDACCPDWNR